MDLIRSTTAALALVVLSANAQEPEPADGSDPGTMQSDEIAASSIEELEPAVSSATLSADLSGAPPAVMDQLDLSRTEITGNQELPKVMYIVPWKKSDPGELTGKPVNTLLDEVLAPVDRTEFLRQVDYYGDLGREDQP